MNNILPKISIIVPVYNVEKYISKTIISLQKQSFHDFEVLVIDDGSLDESIKIAKTLTKDDKRFLFFTKKNGGLSDARNFGLDVSKGKYIAFLDSDDYFEPDFLKKMHLQIVKDEADICICDFRLVTESGQTLSVQSTNISEIITGEDALRKNLKADGINSGMSNKLYKSNLFKDIRFPLGMYYEDYATTFKLFLSSKKITFVNKVLFNYVQREGSITNSLNKKNIDDRFTVYNDMKKHLMQTDNIVKYQSEVLISYLQYVILSGSIQVVKNSTDFENDISYLLKKAEKSTFTINNILHFHTVSKKQMFALLALKINTKLFQYITLHYVKN